MILDIDNLSERALELYKKQKYVDSKQLSLDILETNSKNISVILNLGNIYFLEEDYKKALEYYRRVQKLSGDDIYIWGNLANTYLQMKKYFRATHYCWKILKQDPENVFALNLQAQIHLEQENYGDAILILEQLKALDPLNPWVYNNLSQAFFYTGKTLEALDMAWTAVELSSGEDCHHINLGYTLYEIGLEKTIGFIKPYIEKWEQKYGDNPIVKYFADSLKGNTEIIKTDTEYLKKIFDSFASGFDESLAKLDYSVPKKILQNIKKNISKKSLKMMRVLDLGCGTGLCGKFLSGYAKPHILTGVDLSEKMLEVAKEKNVYNQLICEDIETYLQHSKNFSDLIIAGDVFTYFGDLFSVFKQISKHLDSHGHFIFSVTENQHNDSPWFLHSSGRFQHKEEYVKNTLEKCGLKIEENQHEILRTEAGKKVWGYIFIASKIK